jgi:hypothetical protein
MKWPRGQKENTYTIIVVNNTDYDLELREVIGGKSNLLRVLESKQAREGNIHDEPTRGLQVHEIKIKHSTEETSYVFVRKPQKDQLMTRTSLTRRRLIRLQPLIIHCDEKQGYVDVVI